MIVMFVTGAIHLRGPQVTTRLTKCGRHSTLVNSLAIDPIHIECETIVVLRIPTVFGTGNFSNVYALIVLTYIDHSCEHIFVERRRPSRRFTTFGSGAGVIVGAAPGSTTLGYIFDYVIRVGGIINIPEGMSRL